MPQRVLMAEDIAINRRIQQAQLEPLGVEIQSVINGSQAVESCTTGGIDLALLDLVMPGMDGFSACQALREDARTARMPIMVLTALAGDAKARSLAAGADDFMRKPANSLLLQHRITNLLEVGVFERAWTGSLTAPQGRVLAVSGAPHVRSLLVAQMRDLGSGRECPSLEEAWALLGQDPPSVLAVDWALGPSAVRDFCLRLKVRPELAGIPVLLVHAPSDLPVIEAHPPAVDDFLDLPLQAADAQHRVALLLRLARARRTGA